MARFITEIALELLSGAFMLALGVAPIVALAGYFIGQMMH